MKIVRGMIDATEALCNNRGLNLEWVPLEVRARTESAFGSPLTPTQVVEHILGQVREKGDEAVRELTHRLDNTTLGELEVPASAISDAYHNVADEVIEALRVSANRIRKFHEASLTRGWMDSTLGYGQLINPVRRVGAYIPGGTALYPSTVLMTAIPAKVAGVNEIIICTPTRDGGLPAPIVLVAADLARVDRVFTIGGAQAIAAMAYGTKTVPMVDIICGPGNIFVTIAKKMVFGEVGVDGLNGPTETVVIADDAANPTLCAVDLLAQAEHDVLAKPMMITTSEHLAKAVRAEVATRVERLERGHIAKIAVEQQGYIAIVESLEQAIELSNLIAPEHLCLMVRDPWKHVGQLQNVGAVFLGEYSHEVLGDYVAGPSHVMPTGGTARFSSGLGVHSFVKITPIVAIDDATSRELAKTASLIAREEGLTAHAEAAEVRAELQNFKD